MESTPNSSLRRGWKLDSLATQVLIVHYNDRLPADRVVDPGAIVPYIAAWLSNGIFERSVAEICRSVSKFTGCLDNYHGADLTALLADALHRRELLAVAMDPTIPQPIAPSATVCTLTEACPNAPAPVTKTSSVHPLIAFSLPVLATGAAGAPTDAQIMKAAFDESVTTRKFVASFSLPNLIALLEKDGQPGVVTPLSAAMQKVFAAAGKWLLVSTARPASSDVVTTLRTVMRLIEVSLATKTTANTDPPLQRVTGVFHGQTDSVPDHGLKCGDPFFTVDGPNCRRDVVTHEFFHFVNVHHGGGALDGPTIRSAITTTKQALDSADNLAQFIAEVVTPGGKTDACARAGE